ncbi:MAG: hypothetical protein LBQ01_03275 [Prevotellaceae bacterium]|jgi:hypothetical protein|nr:hypothetical protein [Prevotellaceae bacterium]
MKEKEDNGTKSKVLNEDVICLISAIMEREATTSKISDDGLFCYSQNRLI